MLVSERRAGAKRRVGALGLGAEGWVRGFVELRAVDFGAPEGPSSETTLGPGIGESEGTGNRGESATNEDLLDYAAKIDDELGHLFTPAVR